MALNNYGVLKGRVIDRIIATPQNEHFQILINAFNEKHRIAINVKSKVSPPEVLFFMDDNFQHEFINRILTQNLAEGFTKLVSNPGSIAIDFIRRNLFPTQNMKPIPYNLVGADNDLNEKLDYYIQKAMTDTNACVYAFGQKWGPENKEDKYFHFSPGSGIHDIHMNQGNSAPYLNDNGVYQDGCLFIHLPDLNRWIAFFIAFQVQSFHTDDQSGYPIEGIPNTPQEQPESQTPVNIIAALVNPKGSDPGNEFIILLNKSNLTINLNNWQIVDKSKTKKDIIKNLSIAPFGTTTIKLSGQGAQLGNNGGIITLLNSEGIKISGVSYTKEEAQKEDVLIVFG